jgi:hypothetical protein
MNKQVKVVCSMLTFTAVSMLAGVRNQAGRAMVLLSLIMTVWQIGSAKDYYATPAGAGGRDGSRR